MRWPAPSGRLRRFADQVALLDLGVVALGFGLRLILLGDANIWSDEGLSVWGARQSLAASALYTAGDVHPPLYFWLLHFWLDAVGSSEFAVRLLSVVGGTLIIPLAGWLCRLLAPGQIWVSRLAMLLVATSRFSVWWSQEARMYIFGALFATLSLGLALKLRWRPSRWLTVGYIASAAAGLWTLYLTVFSLVIQGFYWLWSLVKAPTWSERLRLAAKWAVLQAAVLALFTPWLLFTVPRLPSWSRSVTVDPRQFLEIYASLVSAGVSLNVERVRPAVVAALVVIAFGLVALARRRGVRWMTLPGAILLLTLVIVVPPAGVWLVTTMPRSFGKPEARYLIPFAPSVYAAAALAVVGLAHAAGRFKTAAGVLFLAWLVMLSTWSLADYWSERYLADEYKSIVLTIRDYARPDDAVVLHTNDTWPAFAYEFNRPFVSTPAVDMLDEATAEDFLTSLWTANQGMWLVINENALESDPRAEVENWLDQRAAADREWRFGNRRLRFFARSQARAAAADVLVGVPPAPAASDGVQGAAGRLVGWAQPLGRVRAGDVAHLFGYVERAGAAGFLNVWVAEQPSVTAQASVPEGDGTVRVGVQVLVPSDAVVGQMHWVASLGEVGQTVGIVEIAPLPRDGSEVSAPEVQIKAAFGEPALVRFEGYDLKGERQPGGALNVVLHWRVTGMFAKSYKVFVHVVSGDGRVVAQRDDFPLQGRRPTISWRPGEAFTDEYVVQLPPSLPRGVYGLAIGFYDPATGARLGPVSDESGAQQASQQMLIGRLDVR